MLFDLVLRGGTVIDPSRGVHAPMDVAVAGDAIAAVADSIPPEQASRTIDVSGKLVVPGLIDFHAHVFWGVGSSVDPDVECLLRGTTTVLDGGSTGAMAFPGFRRYVMERARPRIFALLNLSTIGILDGRVSDFGNLIHADVDAAVRTIERHRDLIVGLKLRSSNYVVGMDPVPYLKLARQAADAAGTPLQIHIGDGGVPMPEVLPFLRPGDVVVHCFTGRRHGILDPRGRVLEAIVEARRSGILFDAAMGRNHFSFEVARRAIDQGFLPDTISTDITQLTSKDPRFHMPSIMSRHMAVGMSLEQVILAATANPAAILGRVSGLGTLAVGAPGDITVLDLQEGEFVLRDSGDVEIPAARWLEPVLTVRAVVPVGDEG